MRKKILAGILMGAMVLTMMGCKKGDEGEVSKDTTPKPTNAQATEAPEETTAPEEPTEELYEYVDDSYGYSFMMPKYSRCGYEGACFAQENKVNDSMGLSSTEKYIAVFRYVKLSHKDDIDLSKINSVYDMHENVGEYAARSVMRALNSWKLASYDVEVAEKAETINGYEMLKFEGTLIKDFTFDETQTLGITGYYILAEGLPIVVMGVDCTESVYGRDYGGELTLMDSIREEVEAMVQTFSTEQWTGKSFK